MSSSSTQGHYASASLYVGDLAPDVTEATLYEVYHSVGPVASIRVCRDSVTRRSLGYAYVNYHSVADAERALDTLNYTNIKGHPCRIMWSHRDPALRKNNIGNVFVKNLDKSIDNKALYDTFSLFGNILSCKVSHVGVNSAGDDTKSLGYGFIHFESDEAAKTAIERVNGMQIGNKTVYVGPFKKKAERQSTNDKVFTNIYIKHIPESWSQETLEKVFSEFGKITSALLTSDKKGRNFAFVNFEKPESAKDAITALNGRKPLPEGVNLEDEAAAPPTTDEESDAKSSPDETMDRLFVGRAMSKTERQQVSLKSKFAADENQQHRGVNLYIKNLDDTIVEDDKLRELFEPFGKITSSKVMRDSKQQSRGFGFVCFENAEDATRAVTEMHLKLVSGKPLYVGLAEKREQRLARLQQRFRLPPMRPAGVPPGPGMQPQPYPAQQVAYPQVPPAAQGGQGRMMGGYPPSMLPWRNAQGGPRPYSQQGPQTSGMAPQMPMYPMLAPGGGQGIQAAPQSAAMKQSQQPRPYQGVVPPKYQFTQEARNREGMLGGGPVAAGGVDNQWGAASLPHPQDSGPHAKQTIGERLFPLIYKHQPELAGKITGMMLEMDNSELMMILDSETQLKAKIDEAMRVLRMAKVEYGA